MSTYKKKINELEDTLYLYTDDLTSYKRGKNSYLIFSTSDDVIKKEQVPQFPMTIWEFNNKRILDKSSLCSIGILETKNNK